MTDVFSPDFHESVSDIKTLELACNFSCRIRVSTVTNAGTRMPLSSNLKSHVGSFIEEAESTVVNNPGTLPPEPLNHLAAAAAMLSS